MADALIGRKTLATAQRRAVAAMAALAIAACAANGPSQQFTAVPGDGDGDGGSSPSMSGPPAMTGVFADEAGADADDRPVRAQRCDDAGRCTCFNIASIGLPGHTGFQGGMDSTTAFTDWLDTQSSASVDLYTARPTLTSDFLAKYDVIIVQWLVDGTSNGDGTGYWSFSADEIAAVNAWVQAGGGLITLSGYDAQTQEVVPLNQLVQGVTDMSYGTADVLGTVSISNYCLGESDPLGGWVQSTPIGKHLTEVGAFHGRPITPGARAIVDCTDGTNVYAAHEDIGLGHVFAYADEWVTYTSQWLGIDAGAGCADASADVVYQVPQFWYNAITYASQATDCPFTLAGSVIR
ncbi:MAG TPA: hypothetical protein VH044_20025 [Polyangiaceae bacterium]|nr:hypothetical protein [Polyangiaceae bacterium]